MSTPIDEAASACGGLGKLAERLQTSTQTVSNWRVRGVPVERCAELEAVSNGRAKRWAMRPNDWHLIWPELIGAEEAPAVPQAATTA